MKKGKKSRKGQIEEAKETGEEEAKEKGEEASFQRLPEELEITAPEPVEPTVVEPETSTPESVLLPEGTEDFALLLGSRGGNKDTKGKFKESEGYATSSVNYPKHSVASIVLDDDGDVTLIVGSLSTRIRASSQVLRLASPVWKAKFSDRWSVESEAFEMELPDDDEEALLVVLRIAHLHFHQLPPASPMPFHRLLDLAVVCDKYDAVKVVRPFLKAWSQELEELSLQNGYEESLFIAWTFGYHGIYESLASRLVMFTMKGPDGECLNSGGDVLGPTMPLGSIENILKIRQDTISALLDACYKRFDNVLASKACTQGNGGACHASVVGSLVRGFHQLGLFPNRPAASDVHKNINEFSKSLMELPIYTYKPCSGSNGYGHYHNHYENHTACTEAAKLSDLVQDILKNIPSAVLHSHQRHMDEQAKQ